MDLATVLADKPLLASLSREFELLKRTHADIDWDDWITARLKRAAARRTSSNSNDTALPQQQGFSSFRQNLPMRQASVSLRTPSHSKAVLSQQHSKSAGNSRRSSTADGGQQRGPQVVAPARTWQAQDVTNTGLHQADTQQPILVRLHACSGAEQQGVALRQQGMAFQDSTPHSQQPQWVAAARLGAALQASRVVPGMHAAAGRERRLAAAAAVARQQLNLGLTDVPDAVLSAAGDEQQLQPEAQRQLQQMLELTQGVVQQNQLLQQAMQDHQAQLSKHEGLWSAVLQQSSSTGGVPAAAAPAAAFLSASGHTQPAAGHAAGTAAGAAGAAGSAAVPTSAGVLDASPVRSPDQLLEQLKDSWLVQKLLQQQAPESNSKSGKQGATGSALDFIRIAGAARQQPKRTGQEAAAEPQQQRDAGASHGGTAAAAGAGAPAAAAAAADRRKQLKGVLRQMLTQGAVGQLPQGLAGLLEGLRGLQTGAMQQQQNEGSDSASAGAGPQSQAAAASLVALLQKQQQQQGGQKTQLSKAQQLVLQQRNKREERERQRRQQEQESQVDSSGRPGWQSEVYVAPPARMLRAKNGAAADVWNAPQEDAPGPSPPRKLKPAASKAPATRSKKGQQAAGGRRTKAGGAKRSSGGGATGDGGRARLADVLYGGRWRVDGGVRQQREGSPTQRAPGYLGGEQSRLARLQQATSQVLDAVARLEQRLQQQPAAAQRHASAAAAAASKLPQLLPELQEPSALTNLLSALERVEQQERDIHSRWFGSSSSTGAAVNGISSSSGAAANVVSSSSGWAPGSSADASNDSKVGAAAAMPATAAVDGDSTSSKLDIGLPGSSTHEAHCEHPATALDQPLRQQALHVQQQQQQDIARVAQQQGQQGEEQHLAVAQGCAQQECTLDETTMRAIQAGRRRFLRHQAKLDGTLQKPGQKGQPGSSSSRAVLQPDQVVEAVADLLLEELLCAEAQDLEGFCDALCDRLVEDEFEDA